MHTENCKIINHCIREHLRKSFFGFHPNSKSTKSVKVRSFYWEIINPDFQIQIRILFLSTFYFADSVARHYPVASPRSFKKLLYQSPPPPSPRKTPRRRYVLSVNFCLSVNSSVVTCIIWRLTLN